MDENTNKDISDTRKELIELLKMRQAIIEANEADLIQKEQDVQQDNASGKSSNQGKSLSLGNGPSILPADHPTFQPSDNSRFNGGFVNKLLMALLVGFASGAIITATYIFLNLGKVAVSI